MNSDKIIDNSGYIAAFIAFIFSFLLFFSDTLEFMKSLGAAALLSSLVWISYIMLRWIYLALRK